LFIPWKTFIQNIGVDFGGDASSLARVQTLTSGAKVFRIGGYKGGTFRIRYNDRYGASNAYYGGDTLAITTSNVAFKTSTGSLSVSPSGTVGLNSEILVTVEDNDLNIDTDTKQTTYFPSSWSTFGNVNENGLGVPGKSNTSASNSSIVNGNTAKEIFASRISSITNSSFASTSNSVPVMLSETGINSGTFVGTLKLSGTSGQTTVDQPSSGVARLSVSNGDTVTFLHRLLSRNSKADRHRLHVASKSRRPTRTLMPHEHDHLRSFGSRREVSVVLRRSKTSL